MTMRIRRLLLAAMTTFLAFGIFTVFFPCPSTVLQAREECCVAYDSESGLCLIPCDPNEPQETCNCFTGTGGPCGGECRKTWPGCGPFWVYVCNGLGRDEGAIFVKPTAPAKPKPAAE